tara:strand:- start:64 stop:672 length:609 start_codon:yes stop_codon:yes gene_type:complete
MKINCEYLFPKPLWWVDLNEDLVAIKKECYAYREKNPRSKAGASNKHGYQSPDLTNVLQSSAINQLMLSITQCSQEIYQLSREGTLSVDNCWININSKGSLNQIHTHAGSVLSGVFYVKVPLNASQSGHLAFYRDFMESHILSEVYNGSFKANYKLDPTSATKTLFLPKENRLYIFPSWLPHGVEENQTDEERISIAFNMKT